MKNRTRIFATILLVLALISIAAIPAYAANTTDETLSIIIPFGANAVEHDKINSYCVSLTPNASVRSRSINDSSELQLQFTLLEENPSNSALSECVVHAYWPAQEWDFDLFGQAYTYTEDSGSFILGAVSGHSGDICTENFVGLDFTFNRITGNCIATVSFDYDEDNNCQRLSFGENTGEFNNAIYITSMEQKKNANDDYFSICPGARLARSIDTMTKYIGTSNFENKSVFLEAWTRKEISADGTSFVNATVSGNTSSAERIILTLESTATNVCPTNCNVYFYGGNNVKFYNNEYHPKQASEAYTLSLPIPNTDLTVPINIEVRSVNVEVTNNDRTTHWEVKDILGITTLVNGQKLGFENKFMHNGSIAAGATERMNFTCSAQIGYHYVYIDSTGNLNNATWYPSTSVSGYTTCVN